MTPIAAADPQPVDSTWAAHEHSVVDVAFSPDAKQLATVDSAGTMKLWNLADKKELGGLPELINNQNYVRFSPDGKIVYALGKSDSLARFSTETLAALPPLALKSPPGGAAAFEVSPDGKTIALVGRGYLRVISADDGAELQNWVVHENYSINACAFSPDGKSVATAATDHKSLLVEIATGKITWEMPLSLNGTAVAFTRDGKTLYIGVSDGSLMAFDLGTGTGKTLIDQKVTVHSLATSPDGSTLFIGGTNRQPLSISLPDGTLNENPLATLTSNTALTISPDGKQLAGGWMDGSVCLWKTPTK